MKNIKKEKLVPELRFKGFEGRLTLQKLGDSATFSKGKGISKSDITLGGGTECIRYGELYTKYNEVINTVGSSTNLNPTRLVQSEKNDVIIPASGETALDIATASCVTKPKVALGGDINIIKSPINGVFLSYYLNSEKRNDIARLAQGSSVVHIYPKHLETLNLKLPNHSEQTKISSFLTAVDKRIEQITKKKKLLEEYKKGIMQKILNQEIRFKDKNGKEFSEWTSNSLEKISNKVKDKNKLNEYSLVLTNSASQGIVSQEEYFDKKIANILNLGNYYIVKKNDFVYNPRISRLAPVGPISRNNYKTGVMSPLYSVFRPKKDTRDYLELYFSTSTWHRYMKKVANYGARHDRMNISQEDFYNLSIKIPSNPEIQLITKYLKTLNCYLEIVTNSLSFAESFKKGLLQQMFI